MYSKDIKESVVAITPSQPQSFAPSNRGNMNLQV